MPYRVVGEGVVREGRNGEAVVEEADVATLAGLIRAFRDFLGSEEPPDAGLESFLAGAVRDPHTEFCLAETAEGHAVGYSQMLYHESVWALGLVAHLEDVFVLEASRGSGVGRGLLAHAVDRARARGAGAVGLHTNENNAPAQALYRESGFSPATEVRWDGGAEVHWVRSLRD